LYQKIKETIKNKNKKQRKSSLSCASQTKQKIYSKIPSLWQKEGEGKTKKSSL